jgi:hypothetical protein
MWFVFKLSLYTINLLGAKTRAFVHYFRQNVAPAEDHRDFETSLIGFPHERIKSPWWFSNS